MIIEQLKLEGDETILKTVRKHWFILLMQTLGIIVLGIAPLIMMSIVLGSQFTAPFIASPELLYGPATFFGAGWLIIVWMVLFGAWTDYYLDMWVITNKRLIAVDQQGFFHRSVASFRFERLQDITIEIRGIIATLLDIGSIRADTAGHSESFVIKGVPHPRDVKALIQEHADQMAMPGIQMQSAPQPQPRSQYEV